MRKHRIKFEHEGRMLKGSVKMYAFLCDCVQKKYKNVTVCKDHISIFKKRRIKGIDYELIKSYTFDFKFIKQYRRFWIETQKAFYYLHNYKDLRNVVRNPEAIDKKLQRIKEQNIPF